VVIKLHTKQEKNLKESKKKIEKLKRKIWNLKELIAQREEKITKQLVLSKQCKAIYMVEMVISSESLSDLNWACRHNQSIVQLTKK